MNTAEYVEALEEVMGLTDEELRLRVASSCGVEYRPDSATERAGWFKGDDWVPDDETDFVHDLTVMHWAFMDHVVPKGREHVKRFLECLTDTTAIYEELSGRAASVSPVSAMASKPTALAPSGVFYNSMAFMVLGADARQHAEAFVLMMAEYKS